MMAPRQDEDMSKSAEQVVSDVIQRVYGDATQTVLDHEAARQVVAALKERGWAPLNTVGAIIEAAGGQVVVPGTAMLEDYEVTREDDYASFGVRLRARRTAALSAQSERAEVER